MWGVRDLRRPDIPLRMSHSPLFFFWLVGHLARATSFFFDLPWDPEVALVILGAGKFRGWEP